MSWGGGRHRDAAPWRLSNPKRDRHRDAPRRAFAHQPLPNHARRIARNSAFLANLGLGNKSTGNASGGGAISKMAGKNKKPRKKPKKKQHDGPMRRSARGEGRERVSYKEAGAHRSKEEKEEVSGA